MKPKFVQNDRGASQGIAGGPQPDIRVKAIDFFGSDVSQDFEAEVK